MKTLILIFSLSLIPLTSFASASRLGVSNEVWESEKRYLLALITGSEGEYQIGKKAYSKPKSRNLKFYVDISNCKTDKCRELKPIALDAAKRFAADYNEVIGREVITVSEGNSGSIPIRILDDSYRVTAWWANNGYTYDGAFIKIGIQGNRWIPLLVAHEMLNVTGLQDTLQRSFVQCVSFGNINRVLPSDNISGDYEGLCDIEKRAIVFADKHLRPGMRKSSVESAFDKHWLTEEAFKVAEARKGFCSRFPNAETCLRDRENSAKEQESKVAAAMNKNRRLYDNK